MMDASGGAGIASLSVFSGFRSAQSLLFCVVFCSSLLVKSFFFGK
jgi:hypothetical protein